MDQLGGRLAARSAAPVAAPAVDSAVRAVDLAARVVVPAAGQVVVPGAKFDSRTEASGGRPGCDFLQNKSVRGRSRLIAQ